MIKNSLIVLCGLLLGLFLGYIIIPNLPNSPTSIIKNPIGLEKQSNKKIVIGFLPYWLVNKASNDYSKYITTLSYFGLVVDVDGKIQKMASEQAEEPGWTMLRSGRLESIFEEAKKNDVSLSLLVFSGEEGAIGKLMASPVEHAINLINDVEPIMKNYGFTDLNLDIESTTQASREAQISFTKFTREVKSQMEKRKLGSLSVDISGNSLIKQNLINPKEIGEIADYVIIMAYDYHFIGSYVTGPVAPLSGAGVISEYDTQAAVEEARKIIPLEKIIFGAPLYGYEWESLNNTPRSAVIPGTGIIASTSRVEEILSSCSNCIEGREKEADEAYLIFKDEKTGTFHQIFYPDKKAMENKIKFATNDNLGGLALWALGYEDKSILDPLINYK